MRYNTICRIILLEIIMSELKVGTTIRLSNGGMCKVKKELGRGGQGIVYLVDYGGKDHALKWYTEPNIIKSRAFYKNLSNKVISGSPAPNFIWPLAIAEPQMESYGYVMALRPKGYEDMSQFILNHAQFDSVHAQLNACLQICAAFQRLHILGYSYQDMNDGNFFINPKTGDALICDNDNVAPDGTNTGIGGKAGYMAPEIVEGKAMPNKYTDYYSLAVCLFILIYMNRPFEGQWHLSCPCDNNPEMAKKLFGFSSVFIMDPTDTKNRPVKGVHNNVIKRWGIYPPLLANAFCKTFSKEAIKEPTQRLMDKQWHNILLQIRSMCVKCPNCGKETFIEAQQSSKPCLWCQRQVTVCNSLKVGRFTIPLVVGQTIYDCQVTGQTDYDLKAGEVIAKGGQLGIRNLSAYPWTVTLPDNSAKIVNKGEGMPIRAGFKIKFGNQGEISEII